MSDYERWEKYVKTAEFMVTEDHIKLLKAAYIDWFDCEYGAPCVDPKRPYGNSGVEHDIAQLLGWEIPEIDTPEWDAFCKRARDVHEETQLVLQILVANADKGIQPGLYRCRVVGTIVKRREWKLSD